MESKSVKICASRDSIPAKPLHAAAESLLTLLQQPANSNYMVRKQTLFEWRFLYSETGPLITVSESMSIIRYYHYYYVVGFPIMTNSSQATIINPPQRHVGISPCNALNSIVFHNHKVYAPRASQWSAQLQFSRAENNNMRGENREDLQPIYSNSKKVERESHNYPRWGDEQQMDDDLLTRMKLIG